MEDLTEYSSLSVRVWLLLLLSESGDAGLQPIERLRFHKLLFLSNTLASVYGSQLPAAGVTRNIDGPFYPRLQWHLDRLVGMGLVLLEKVDRGILAGNDKHSLTYKISRSGFLVVNECLTLTTMKRLRQFFHELCFSFATIEEENRDITALNEVNYARKGPSLGSFVDLSTRRSNLTVPLTEYFASFVPQQDVTNRREQVRLYVKYLQEITAKAS